MKTKYYAILTHQGAAKLANAAMSGNKLNLTQMAVGDANGGIPTPDPTQTRLINQQRIAPLNLLSVTPDQPNQIIAEQIIPENEGGYWIREIGLYDDAGVLIAIANCPETYKPLLQEGGGRTQTVRMVLSVTSTDAVTLKTDPSVVLATREYVDNNALLKKNNLSEIKEAGTSAQSAAREALGLGKLAVLDDLDSWLPERTIIRFDSYQAMCAGTDSSGYEVEWHSGQILLTGSTFWRVVEEETATELANGFYATPLNEIFIDDFLPGSPDIDKLQFINATFTEESINLQGKIITVTAEPCKNFYRNGSFRLSGRVQMPVAPRDVDGRYLASEPSTFFSVTAADDYVSKLKIKNASYTYLDGVYRYLNTTGGINWYFLFLSIYESAGKVFSLADKRNICEKALNFGIFAPFMTSASYIKMQRIVIEGKLFFVNTPGTTGNNVPDVANARKGDFVRTGTVVLECLGEAVRAIPASWQWFFADIAPDLLYPVAPDSNDSYAALWIAVIGLFADKTWLMAPSGVANYSRWEIIKNVAEYNLVQQIEDINLTRTFQGNIAPGGGHYFKCFCQDNAEVFAGFRAMASLAAIVDDSEGKTRYTGLMNTIKSGLLALFVDEQNRFKAVHDETGYQDHNPTYTRFVNSDRFSLAPWRFGVLNSRAELAKYGWPVLDRLHLAFPRLYLDTTGIDDFALADWFAFVAKTTGSVQAATAAVKRVHERINGRVTLSDAVAAISVSSWGTVPSLSLDNFMRLNGQTVFSDEEMTIYTREIRHITPANNAQVVISNTTYDTAIFVDNDASLSWLQFMIASEATDGAKLLITAAQPVERVSFIAEGVSVYNVPNALPAGQPLELTFNAPKKMWCGNTLFARDVRHFTPSDNAQIAITKTTHDTAIFIDNNTKLNYLQFKFASGAADGARLTITCVNTVSKVSFIAEGVSVRNVPTVLQANQPLEFTYNSATSCWYGHLQYERENRHMTPVNNAQVVVRDINRDTTLFIDNTEPLEYLQFKFTAVAPDGIRLVIAPANGVTRTSFIAEGVTVNNTPTSFQGGKSYSFTYNALTTMWCGEQ